MNEKKIMDFIVSMREYDGFSDVNFPAARFWDLNLDEKKDSDFSFNCIFNLAEKPIVAKVETVDHFLDLMDDLKTNFSDLNATDFPEYTKGDFDFQSRLVGFVACAQFNHIWSIIPIIELSGPDATSIVTAMALVS